MLFEEIKIFAAHGIQYVKDVTKVELPSTFRGRIEISEQITGQEAARLVEQCPVAAITRENILSVNLGKCVFCNECHFACPDKVKFTNDYKIATNDLSNLVVKAGDKKPILLNPDLVRKEIIKFFGNALKLRQISAGGDNSSEMELNAAGNVNFDMGRWGIEFVASPRHADGLVITGPISENMATALDITYNATPGPKIIILAGTDAISGGIFEGSPAIKRTFLEKYPVDLYVPGNPVHPLTFINGILELTGRTKRQS